MVLTGNTERDGEFALQLYSKYTHASIQTHGAKEER